MNPTLDERTEPEPDCRSGGPMRVLLVHQEKCAFTCLWRLTSYFEGLDSGGNIAWSACAYADSESTASSVAAAERARQADLIVFCQGESSVLPESVKTWVEQWLPAKAGQEAAMGVLIPCGCDSGDGPVESYLRDAAARGGMTFLGVAHCSCKATTQQAAANRPGAV